MGNFFPFLMLLSLLSIANGTMADPPVNATGQAKVHIVYLGEKPHNDEARIVKSHYDILAKVVGSKEEAKKLTLYNYKHIFSGFAAKLTKDQAKNLTTAPGVRKVWVDSQQQLLNTRSWNSLGLSADNKSHYLLQETNMGDGIIIGVIDSGIWSESKAFSHEGLGPVPSGWKGNCSTKGKFDSTKHCNRKIIGARLYMKGLMEMSASLKLKMQDMEPSPLDDNGHGTHVASTLAGSFVPNVDYCGLNLGTFRGGAPRARLAIYKACHGPGVCISSDVVAAVDDAVHDGVDVLQVSSRSEFPVAPEIEKDSSIAMATFHAVARGVSVVVASGNEGPVSYSVAEVAPWTISVAASVIDRRFNVPITLGDNQTLPGRGFVIGKGVDFSLINIVRSDDDLELLKEIGEIKGNVVIAYFNANSEFVVNMTKLGCVGIIFVSSEGDPEYQVASSRKTSSIPVVIIDYEAGNQIYEYSIKSMASRTECKVKIGTTNVVEGKPLSPMVATFSSRGPSALHPEILKPDIAAPGSNILAAVPPGDNDFGLKSGTSMAAPHISAIVALLKVRHPDWSPAAIRSALVTTAFNGDSSVADHIFAQGSPPKVADPFDFGGGIVEPNKAGEPGLVYDMNKDDYLNYLCSQPNFPVPTLSNVSKVDDFCQNRLISLLDLNLPSITIPNLKKSVTVRRTVTNVGPADSVYKVTVKSPRTVKVSVEPSVLKFDSKTKTLSFKVTVTAAQEKLNTGYVFGSLTWSDGKHFVRSPISVRTTFLLCSNESQKMCSK